MNRILQAEVILTLTREQAASICAALSWSERNLRARDPESAARYLDAWSVVAQQCKKQGCAIFSGSPV